MKNPSEQIENLLEQANKSALFYIQTEVIAILKSSKKLNSFCMCMGSASFGHITGNNPSMFYYAELLTERAKKLLDFIADFDSRMYLTGEDIHIARLKSGEIIDKNNNNKVLDIVIKP